MKLMPDTLVDAEYVPCQCLRTWAVRKAKLKPAFISCARTQKALRATRLDLSIDY